MGTRHLATLLFVALGLMVVGSALAAGPGVDSPQVNESTNESGAFGQQLSSFMQASAADADASTERGMWRVEVNRSENATERVIERVQSLEQRLQQLQNRSERLEMKRANGTIPEVAYNARASSLRAQIQNVRAAINGTATVAHQRGVTVTQLDDLRNRAADLQGPTVSAAARNITDAPRGPPAEVPGNGPGANGTDGGPPNNSQTARPPGQQNSSTDSPHGKHTPVVVGPDQNRTTRPTKNRTDGPQTNRTTGPSHNTTDGPQTNRTTGPSDNPTDGPQTNRTTGPTTNRTSGPPTAWNAGF